MNLHYFQGNVSQGFVAIYSTRMILRIAGALISLFLPIFLYILFDFNIKYVLYYYLIGHLLYGFSVAFGCQYLNKIGLRRSIKVAVFLGAIYYFLFYLLAGFVETGEFALLFNNKIFITLIIITIILALHRIAWWMPIHTDIAKFTDKKNRAKELSAVEATTLFTGAIGPIIAGWILMKYNFDILFFLGIIIYLISFLPLMYLPRTKEKFSWGYFETWKKFFSKKRRRAIIAFAGNGAEDVVGVVIWPIFIFNLLKGNYFEIGALTSLVVAVTIIMQLLAGNYADKKNKDRMIHWGSAFYAVGWIIKVFIATAFQIFIVSTFHNFTRIFARTPFDALTYERAADQGH
ncbi:hypothetical protein DRH27_03585, partial [Candidatus Falkowbacteria bacterium]